MDPEKCLIEVSEAIQEEYCTDYPEAREKLWHYYRWVADGGYHTPLMDLTANLLRLSIRQHLREEYSSFECNPTYEKTERYIESHMYALDVVRQACICKEKIV